MQTKANLQDLFLLRARRDKLPVTMFLMNGFQMRGTIAGFDAFVVVLAGSRSFTNTRSPPSRRCGRWIWRVRNRPSRAHERPADPF